MRGLACWIGSAALLCVSLSIHAQSEVSLSAWDALLRKEFIVMEEVAELEREILQLMTESQVQDYLQGTDASEITLMNGETLEMFLMRKGVVNFDLSWYSVDGGGGGMSGGGVGLTGSVGQPDVGVMSGGEFTLTSGFLSIESLQASEIPCGTFEGIFCDSFESGDLSTWSSSVGAI